MNRAGSSGRGEGPRSSRRSFLEWGGMLAALAAGPDAWVAARLERHGEDRFRVPSGPERWCALEVLCHLRDVDADVLLPRLERVLTEDQPAIPALDMTEAEARYREASPRAALEGWRAARARLLARLAPLTPRECEILELIAEGQSNKAMARQLGLGPETIKTHLKHVFAKLGVERRTQAVLRAKELGLVRPRVPFR